MDTRELADEFLSRARRDGLRELVGAAIASPSAPVAVTGVAGSAAAMALAGLERPGGAPVTVVADTADDAGYLYQDLCALCGQQAVMFFPSGYKRDIKYGQEDPPSQVLRTETLSHWNDDPALRFVVTYPEAVAERVAPREAVRDHTLQIDVGGELRLDEIGRAHV